jgi:hypothetical protein
LVPGNLAFFVSNELVHQSHETHLRIFGYLRILGAADVLPERGCVEGC